MEDKNKETLENHNETYVPKYTKHQSALYTIISIALFCLVYFGGKYIISNINQPYCIYRFADNTNEELTEFHFDYANVSQEYELEYIYSKMEKNESGYKISILFSGFDDMESFADNAILFEFGNAIENIDNEFYPYPNNINIQKYAIATKYVDNDNPNNEILVFEYEDKLYAEFQSYGTIVPTEVKILFDGCEKVY